MKNVLNPGNDVMCSILSLLIETLIYGFVILLVVTLLLWVTLSMFCIDNPSDTEEIGSNFLFTSYHESDWSGDVLKDNKLTDVKAISRFYFFEGRPFSHRAPFPEYFSKRAESLLDICFLVFPTVVVIFILVPTLGFLYNNEFNLEHVSTAMSIDVVGHQWYWSYEYHLVIAEELQDFSFDSILDVEAVENYLLEVDRHVVIPTDVYISITITSTDVIHSWAVPQLGIKVDAIPGRIASTILYSSIDGIYYGQCSELCGVLHGFMPICVESVSIDLFLHWVYLNIDFSISNYTSFII